MSCRDCKNERLNTCVCKVYIVVDWVDGIPEFVRAYRDEAAATQYASTVGGNHQVLRKDYS
jgi:hypothetical protein